MFFYIFVFTALRATIMDYVLIPFARFAQVPIKKYERFAEQSWACIYYTFSFVFGIVSNYLGKGFVITIMTVSYVCIGYSTL